MLKFIKHHLVESIGGLEFFPILSLVIFTSIFAIASIIAIRAKKQYIHQMSNLPLED